MKKVAAKFCWKSLLGLLLCDTYKKKKKKKWSEGGQKMSIWVQFWLKFIIFCLIAAIMDLQWSIFFFNLIRITNAQLLSPKVGQYHIQLLRNIQKYQVFFQFFGQNLSFLVNLPPLWILYFWDFSLLVCSLWIPNIWDQNQSYSTCTYWAMMK